MSTSKDDKAANIIAAPFIAVIRAGQIIAKTLGNVEEATRVEAPPQHTSPHHDPPPVPRQSQQRQYLHADKAINIALYNGRLPVSFYLYNKNRVIRAEAKKDGVVKELFFTPEIAAQRGVLFNIHNAAVWVEETGFRAVRPSNLPSLPQPAPQAAPAAVAHPASLPPAFQEDAFRRRPEPAPQESPPRQQPLPRQPPPPRQAEPPVERMAPRSSAPVSDSGKALPPPFEGVIVFMGSVDKPSYNGRPGYKSYAFRLRSQYGGMKEFLGEHLQELAGELSLKTGKTIRLRKLGQRPFTVVVNGKSVERSRNEYSIEVL